MSLFKWSLVVLVCLTSQGCSLSSFPFIAADENNLSSSTIQSEVLSESRNGNLAEVGSNKIIQTYIKEFEELRPQLIKLIEMEADLSFFLEQVAQNSNISPEPFYEMARERDFRSEKDSGIEYVEASGMKFEGASGMKYGEAMMAELEKLSNPMSKPEKITANANSVKLESAAPIGKFQNIPEQNQSFLYTSDSIDDIESIDEKFSSSQSKIARLAKSTPLNSSSSSAIHLVSVSSKKNLPDFWKQLELKFPQLFINKQPLVESVAVDGKSFFSLRIGPYSTKNADNTCKQLINNGNYCGVVDYIGVPL